MLWYRGVTCKRCGQDMALKRIDGPEEGPLSADGPQSLVIAGIPCPHCGHEDSYVAGDFKAFATWEPIPGVPPEGTPSKKPN